MASNNGLTPTQKRILAILSDGELHTSEELRQCLYDDLTTLATLQVHIFGLRGKLKKQGQDILGIKIYEYRKSYSYYQLVRKVAKG